jgi:CMP-N-acetylneuraminic acid synthetase
VTPRIVAIVPMRHDSERVRGKNYRVLGDRPLFHHVVTALLECPEIAETIIDTDSPTIMDDARRSFPQVRLLERPEHLRGGMVPMNDVLLNVVNQVDADLYLQTHSTNPLLRGATISAGIQRFLDGRPQYDSLFGVTRLQTRLWTADGKPMNHDPAVLLRTQDLAPVYEENSCLYLFSRASLELRGSRIGKRPLLYEIPKDEAWDIDDETDWAVVEALVARGAQGT